MLHYIIRRLLLSVLTLLLVSCLIYALIRSMPGSPLVLNFSETDPSKRLRPEDLAAMRAYYGIDKPWYVAYFSWLTALLGGDMGQSFLFKKSVTTVIGER